MSQREEILSLIKERGKVTHGEISVALYGDNKNMPYVYGALKKLVDSGVVMRTGDHPSFYSLSNNDCILEIEKDINNKDNECHVEITNETIEKVDAEVEATNNYGRENKLITDCLKKYQIIRILKP